MPNLITIKEAAEMLSVAPCTVERMLTRGELAGYQFPAGAIRIDSEDIDLFLKSCRLNSSERQQS